MSDSSFSLVPVWQILWNWRARIIMFVAFVSAATAVAVFFLPKYYLSAAIAVPANPVFSDKSKLFNNNIQSLYSPYGSSDDLDRLCGIAELDTVYKTIIKEFKLIRYYELPENDTTKSVYKALKALKEDLRIQQTEKGQMKILMWHKDRNIAAAIVNRVADITQQIAMTMQLQYNSQSLNNINAAIKQDAELLAGKTGDATDFNRYMDYKIIAGHLKIAIANNPPALIIQEHGYAAGKEDKPKKLAIIVTAFFLSLLFAVLTALLYHRKNNHAAPV